MNLGKRRAASAPAQRMGGGREIRRGVSFWLLLLLTAPKVLGEKKIKILALDVFASFHK